MADMKWKSQVEIDAEKAEAEKTEMLPKPEERIAQLEEMIMQLLLMS